MNYKKKAIFALCIAAITAILPALMLVIYVDPFFIYHKPLISGMPLQGNQRYQNAGLINSYLADRAEGYDSVIVGTSMSQNFTGEDVSRILLWERTLRLAMPGAAAEEQLTVLRHALASGRVKHVLLEVHPFLYQDVYRQQKHIIEDPTLYFPRFLYNANLFDDTGYVFNIDVLKMSWRILKHDNTLKQLTTETIGYWGDYKELGADHDIFNSTENILKIQEQTKGFVLKTKTEAEIAALVYPMLTDTLFPLLENYCNSDIEIVMYVPPWPRYRYQKSEKVAMRSLYMMRRILENSSMCENISLYNFDLLDFVGDLNNYKDEQHYLPDINRLLLDRISKKQNRLTIENISRFEADFIDILNHYRVYSSYRSEILRD